MPGYADPGFDTLAVHAGAQPDPSTGARAVPIHLSTSFVFESSEHAVSLFNLERSGYVYSRISNPTNAVLEQRVAALEGGIGAIATASGQAALHLGIATLMGAGGHIVASTALYGGSQNLLHYTLPRFGIETTFVQPGDLDAWRAAIRPNTRLLFGESVGKQLLQPMAAFYHLVGVRKPEFMGWGQVASAAGHSADGIAPIQDTEFSADEFGNELERYIQSYEAVKQQLQRIEYNLPSDLQSAFFAAVKYPVYAAAAMAVKQLQAQEARHIARKENFHRDEDALESAVRSWKAYRELALLTEQYNKQMADGKWQGLMNMAPRNQPVFMAPLLPDQLTADELKQYDTYQPEPTRMELDGCIVKNAYDYTTATEGTTVIDMLGHSMRAVALPKGGSVSYRFFADRGDAVLRTALIPTHPLDGGDLRYAVSVDGGEPIVYSLSEAAQSERWKVNVLRGQSIRSENIRLSQGAHTLTITALDDHILLDQWMIDYDTDRLFYMFPIQPAYAGAR